MSPMAMTYFITLAGMNGTAQGTYGDTVAVTPKDDPDAPSGAMVINSGAPVTHDKNVILTISAIRHARRWGIPAGWRPISQPATENPNQVSADIQMRISNDVTFAGAPWEP